MTYNVEKILDIPVDIMTMTDIVSDIDTYMTEQKKMTLTSVNPQIILMAESNQAVRRYIENSTHRFPDGIGLVKVSNWTKGKIEERVAGIDVMMEVLRYANTHKKSVFLYGARPQVVSLAAKRIEQEFPDLVMAGYVDGYTTKKDEEIVAEINDKQVDIVFVALGSPKQELWLETNIPLMTATVFQTVGGSLDVISGTVKRAPDVFIKTNLEWLYRSCSNPKRLNRMIQLPVFVAKSLVWEKKNRKQ